MSLLCPLSYGSASLSFMLLGLWLLLSQQSRGSGGWLIGASIVTCVWAALLAYDCLGHPLPLSAVFWADVLHDAAWLLALSGLTPLLPPRARKQSSATLVPIVAGVLLLFALLYERETASWLVRAGLAVPVTGLVLLCSGFARRGLPVAGLFCPLPRGWGCCSRTTLSCSRSRPCASRSLPSVAGSRLHRHCRSPSVGDCRAAQPQLVAGSVCVAADGPVRCRGAGGCRLSRGRPRAGGLPGRARGAVGPARRSRVRECGDSRVDGCGGLQEPAAACACFSDQTLLPQQIRLPARVAALRRHALDRRNGRFSRWPSAPWRTFSQALRECS